MKSGSAITSRESHEVRHIAAVRHARSGRPRWKNEATSPSAQSASASSEPTTKNRRTGIALHPNAPPTSAAYIARNSPCPAPMRVVRKTTENAGRMNKWCRRRFSRIRLRHHFPGEVVVGGAGAPFGHQGVAVALGDGLRDLA